MIRNRLAELLAERKLKISRVANDIPNLSRNTITSTSQNDTKMIQIETVNALCQYLEIAPKDFFEYLPFDVHFSAVLNEVKPIIKNNVDEFQLLVKNLELDVYAEQTFLRSSGAQKKQTFDLMTIQTEEQVLPVTIGGTDSTDDAMTELQLSILLGHTTDKESYITQEEPFKKFWGSITPGFKPIVTNDLMTVCSEALAERLDEILDSTDMNVGDSFYKPDINWKHIQKVYNISFSNAYSFKDYKPATIEFVDKPNNSNDGKIDISDDDLPY